ncbi:MAG: hypothetical protein RIS76_2306 [Verrucomicrobiota bacterium]
MTVAVQRATSVPRFRPAQSALAVWLWLACLAQLVSGEAAPLELDLRTRDVVSGAVIQTRQTADPARIGVVVMDMWSYHWCMTCAERASALVPRMNRALAGARKLGMTVIFTPTSAIASHEASPQRKAAQAVPAAAWPALRPVNSPACALKNAFSCRCGPGVACPRNWGGDAMNPALKIGADDFIAWGTPEVWNIVQARKLERLLYIGVAADICVLGKGEGMVPLRQLGVPCALARDLTDTDSYPPAEALEHTLRVLEAGFAPTFDFGELLAGQNLWPDDESTEMVRIRPWGKPMRPYFFRDNTTVHLELPSADGREIRYTLDDSPPAASSACYEGPLSVTNRVTLRARAFRGGQPVGLASAAFFVPLPASPPAPTLRLWELNPTRVRYADAKSEWHVPARTWGMTMRGENYFQGITLHAPGEIEFAVPPGATRFVALAGADDAPKGRFNAQFLGQHPSMTFQVLLDGRLQAESPVMRLGQVPWPFDVPIPHGAKTLRLAVTDAGNGARLDLGDFAQSGFIIPDYQGPKNLY